MIFWKLVCDLFLTLKSFKVRCKYWPCYLI